jgi:thiosulfate/3-mercaptopyruvate sulfurtransferase
MGAAHHPRTAGAVDSTEREVSMTAATRYAHPDAIVNTSWLADNLRDPSLRVFDCTTYLRYETGRAGRTGSRAAAPTTTRGTSPARPSWTCRGALRQLGQVQLHHARPRRPGRPVRGEGHRGGDARRPVFAREHAVGDARVVDAAGGRLRRRRGARRRLRQVERRGAADRDARRATRRRPRARPRPGLFVGKDEVKAAIGDAGTARSTRSRRTCTGRQPALRPPRPDPGSVNVPAAALVDAAR